MKCLNISISFINAGFSRIRIHRIHSPLFFLVNLKRGFLGSKPFSSDCPFYHMIQTFLLKWKGFISSCLSALFIGQKPSRNLRPLASWQTDQQTNLSILNVYLNVFRRYRWPGTKSHARRSTDMTCSVWPWWDGFSLCRVLMRKSSEFSRHLVILWRTLQISQALPKRSCWSPVWVKFKIHL